MGSYPSKFHVVTGGSSQNTTLPWFVGDFRAVSISVSSSATFPTSIGVQVSNADGFGEAIPANSWVTFKSFTGISTSTLTVLDGGYRWVRTQSGGDVSAASMWTVALAGTRF